MRVVISCWSSKISLSQSAGLGTCGGRGRKDSSLTLQGGRKVRLYPCFLAHPVSFPFCVSLQHPLVSSLVSRGNSAEIINSRALRLVWAQNQPTLGKIPRYFAGIPEKPRIPGKYLVFCRFPRFRLRYFAADQLSDSGKLESCQNGAPNTLWFPGNFRKRKVLGTLSFPFWFPETWVGTATGQAASSSLAMRRHGVRVNSNLRYPKNGNWGGSLLLGGGSRQTFEIPLKKTSEERPRGACLGVSEGPRSLRGCAERGWLGGTGLQRVGPGTL